MTKMRMPNAPPVSLRERAVRAYEAGTGGYDEVAERFGVGSRTLQEWVAIFSRDGRHRAATEGGGNPSPVDVDILEGVLRERPDAIVDELRAVYNDRVPKSARVHRSSILRALHRRGYVFKENVRGLQNKRARTSKRSAGSS